MKKDTIKKFRTGGIIVLIIMGIYLFGGFGKPFASVVFDYTYKKQVSYSGFDFQAQSNRPFDDSLTETGTYQGRSYTNTIKQDFFSEGQNLNFNIYINQMENTGIFSELSGGGRRTDTAIISEDLSLNKNSLESLSFDFYFNEDGIGISEGLFQIYLIEKDVPYSGRNKKLFQVFGGEKINQEIFINKDDLGPGDYEIAFVYESPSGNEQSPNILDVNLVVSNIILKRVGDVQSQQTSEKIIETINEDAQEQIQEVVYNEKHWYDFFIKLNEKITNFFKNLFN